MLLKNTLLSASCRLFVACSWLALFGGGAHASEWNAINSPARLEPDFVASFDRMPLESKVPLERMPYADTYWPTNRGSIAYRWNSKDPIFAWRDPHEIAPLASF